MSDSIPFEAFLTKHPQIRFVHLQWLDYTSTVRARVFPLRQMREMLVARQAHRLGGLNMTLIDDSAPLTVNNPSGPVGEPVGQARLIPDLESIRLCPGVEGHASIFCDFSSVSVDANEAQLTPADTFAFCPRSTLHWVTEHAHNETGLGFFVGFEIEFACVPQQTLATAVVHQTSGLRTLEAYMMPVLCDISEGLEKSGISIQHFHAEGSANQYEIAMAPLPPLQAADAFITTREAIRRICHTHAMDVSFHPWHPAQNGVHLNLSLYNASMDNAQSLRFTGHDTEENFLAGILHHLNSLFAIGFPYTDCYHRTRPGRRGTGSFKAWGTQNRELPVRKKGPGFWEFKFLDASTQTYLFLAALIAAGHDGIQRCTPLSLADCKVDPNMVSEDERQARGITERLPSGPEEANNALRGDKVLQTALGEKLVPTFMTVLEEYNRRLDNVGPLDSKERRDWLTARM